LGVGVPGSGRSGFAAATHRNPSSGGLAYRPYSGVVVLRRGDGLQLHRPAAQQCSSLSPLLFFSPTLSSFLFLHEQRLRDGHGACALRSAFPTPPIFPSSSGLRRSKKENPQGSSRQGRRRILGPKSPRRRNTGRTGAVEFIGRRPRVPGLESGRRGCGVGARGSIRCASATGRWPWGGARLHGRERQRKREEKRWGKRRADRRVPHVSGCGVWLVVSGLAGCVGPKGLVGCGLGAPEEGFEVV
jgi:hypothetical protein